MSAATSMRRVAVLAASGVSLALPACAIDAQVVRLAALTRRSVADAGITSKRTVAAPSVAPEPSLRAPWWAPAASALVPGTGQFLLKQQRSVAYAVAEGFLVVQALAARRDERRDRERFRTLASDIARASFGGSRPIGPWSYYEHLEKFAASGSYDLVPGGVVDPETDESTYNGSRWLLARETFWANPDVTPALGSIEYTRALNAYIREAVTDEYRWSWRDASLQQDVYRQTITSANRSAQRVNNVIGLIGANHLASLVDAYVSVRVRRFGGAGVAGLRLDGVTTDVQTVGDLADGKRMIRTQFRLVAR